MKSPARLFGGGEARLAALRACLRPQPDILLLDEPTKPSRSAGDRMARKRIGQFALRAGADQP